MTMQTVSLSALEPGRGNPRKAIDRRSIEGLAASIRNDGLLQNLVVSPVKGKGQHYRIVSGERRFRALKLLQQRGELDGDGELGLLLGDGAATTYWSRPEHGKPH
jgi:ParB family transcriptional regulator, chromosome partitioning protein